MKNKIILIILLTANTFTFGQTDKGNKLVGGTVRFGTQYVQNNDNLLFLNFNPNYGKFVNDYIAAGAGINLNFQKQMDNTKTSVSLLPFGRYYVGDSDVLQFYIELKGGVIYQIDSNPGGATTISGFQVNTGPGVAFFLNDNVSLDFLVNYKYVRLEEIIVDKRLIFNFFNSNFFWNIF